VTGPGTAIPASAALTSERHWRTTRRAADLTWVVALLVAIPLSPVARYYLLSWPGVLEWALVVVIAVGLAVRTVADRRLRAVENAAGESGLDDVATPPRSRSATVVAWVAVGVLVPVAVMCLVQPLAFAISFDWAPMRSPSAFETVLIATFLLCPYLVGLLVWWLVRGVGSTPERLAVAILVACATGLLVYGSLGYLSPVLSGLL